MTTTREACLTLCSACNQLYHFTVNYNLEEKRAQQAPEVAYAALRVVERSAVHSRLRSCCRAIHRSAVIHATDDVSACVALERKQVFSHTQRQAREQAVAPVVGRRADDKCIAAHDTATRVREYARQFLYG